MMIKEQKILDPLVSIRGIAAWWVVLFHSLSFMAGSITPALHEVISHGYLAVDLFFVLSGFVIFLNYHETVLISGLSGVVDFYWKRFTRIYPVHFSVMTAYLILALCYVYFSNSGRVPDSYTLSGFFASVFLVQTWTGEALSWNVPAWSISAEWSVYLLFPLIALLFRRCIRTLHYQCLAAVSMLFSIAGVYTVMDVSSLGGSIPQMALPRALFEFMLGCIAGSLFVLHEPVLAKCRSALAFALICMFFAYVSYDINDYFIVPGASFLLVCYLSIDDSFICKALSNKALVYLGQVSYPTYIVHYLIYDALKAGWVVETGQVKPLYLVLSFLAVLLISIFMHHTLEVPAQKFLRNSLGRRTATSLPSTERS